MSTLGRVKRYAFPNRIEPEDVSKSGPTRHRPVQYCEPSSKVRNIAKNLSLGASAETEIARSSL
jgi:hypothetical protein